MTTKAIVTIPSKMFVTDINKNRIIFKLEIVSSLVSVSRKPTAENRIEKKMVRNVIFFIRASVDENGFLST